MTFCSKISHIFWPTVMYIPHSVDIIKVSQYIQVCLMVWDVLILTNHHDIMDRRGGEGGELIVYIF